MKNFLENRYTYAKLLAIIGMAAGGIFYLLTLIDLPEFLYYPLAIVWIGGTIGAYLCGGLFKAVKMAVNIAKWGWLLVPVFPIDIAIGLGVGFMGLMMFIFVPIIPIYKAEKEYGV